MKDQEDWLWTNAVSSVIYHKELSIYKTLSLLNVHSWMMAPIPQNHSFTVDLCKNSSRSSEIAFISVYSVDILTQRAANAP
jgi:hypothetical protein